MKNLYLVIEDSLSMNLVSPICWPRDFVIRSFDTDQKLIAELESLTPGCILLDLAISEVSAFEVISAALACSVELPVVVAIGSGDVAQAVRAMKEGAVDVVVRPIVGHLLLEALTGVFALQGLRELDDDRRAAANGRLAALTRREQDVLRGLTAGRSNKLLAHDFGISIRTVEMHRSSMMDRLGVKTFAEALRVAFDGAAKLSGHRPSSQR